MSTHGTKIERYGHLTKLETLTTVSVQKLSGTLVLEAPEPFPGSSSYYSEAPQFAKPLYVYFVLDGSADLEKVARATQKSRTLFPWEFDAAFCSIQIFNETFNAIRIRHLGDFNQIPKLQETYQKVGIEFKKSSRNYDGKGFITLKKLFYLEKFEDDLYLDIDEKDHGYFTIPEGLSFDEFAELVKRVKYNWDFMKIDVAQAFFYTDDRIEDVLRVYHPEMNLKILDDVKKQFLIRI